MQVDACGDIYGAANRERVSNCADALKQQWTFWKRKSLSKLLPSLKSVLAVQQAQMRINSVVERRGSTPAQLSRPRKSFCSGVSVKAQNKTLRVNPSGFDGARPKLHRLSAIGKPLKSIDNLPIAKTMIAINRLAVERDVGRQGASHNRLTGQRRKLIQSSLCLPAREQPIRHSMSRRHQCW